MGFSDGAYNLIFLPSWAFVQIFVQDFSSVLFEDTVF